MNMGTARNQIIPRAVEALKSLLGQISVIELQKMRCEPLDHGRHAEITAHIKVHGHERTLTCRITSDTDPRRLRTFLNALCASVDQIDGQATPVLIAPSLSPEARAMCSERNAGFIDQAGNARLMLGDVFIVRRTLPHQTAARELPEVFQVAQPPAFVAHAS